jgi:hypothetical protein
MSFSRLKVSRLFVHRALHVPSRQYRLRQLLRGRPVRPCIAGNRAYAVVRRSGRDCEVAVRCAGKCNFCMSYWHTFRFWHSPRNGHNPSFRTLGVRSFSHSPYRTLRSVVLIIVAAFGRESNGGRPAAAMASPSTAPHASFESIWLRLWAESTDEYSIFALSPTGVVLTWNPNGERIQGYKAHDLIGQPFSMFYTQGDQSSGVPDSARASGCPEVVSSVLAKRGNVPRLLRAPDRWAIRPPFPPTRHRQRITFVQ